MRNLSAFLLLFLMSTALLQWGGAVSPAASPAPPEIRTSPLKGGCIATCRIRLVSPGDFHVMPAHGGDKG
jgi:hypothetical protein